MLKFILICALVGGVIGLLFSRNGDGGKGFSEGATRGIGCGCGCVTISVILLILLGLLILVPIAL